MSFLFPAFLIGTLTAAMPIILHLLTRHRVPRQDFSDVRFLVRTTVRDNQHRRLRELLLLALRVTALVLLALAFARPVLDATMSGAAATIVIIDRSLSMSAPGQFARARQLAGEVIESVPSGAAVAVVAFDDRAEVMQEPTASRSAVTSAIDRIESTAGGTRFATGLAVAGELLRGRPGRVVMITDGQQVGWDDDARVRLPPETTVEMLAVGVVDRNLAVTAVASRDEMVMATMLNTAESPADTELVVEVDGRVVAREPVTLIPGATERTWDVGTAGEVVSVTVSDSAGYQGDDTRHAWRAPPEPTDVLIVVSGGRLDVGALYLEQALLASTAERPFRVSAVAPAALGDVGDQRWESTAVTVVLSTVGLSRGAQRRLAGFVRAGGGLLVTTGPDVDPRILKLGWLLDGQALVASADDTVVAERRLAVTDVRHPIFRPFGDTAATFGQVRFTRTTDIESASGSRPARTLAHFDTGLDALVEVDVAPGRALVFASDLNNRWNDFPRHRTFVPFVHETLRYLAGPLLSDDRRDLLPSQVPLGTERRVVINSDPRESVPQALTANRFLARVEAVSVDVAGEPAGASEYAYVDAEARAREAEDALWWHALTALALALVAEAWLGRTMT